MDLSRLVNSDAPSQQTSSKAAPAVAQQYAPPSVGQGQPTHTGADHRTYGQQGNGVLSRQTSFGAVPTRPSEHAAAHAYPPSLNTGVSSYTSQHSTSPSPYPQYQPSPYTAHPASASRPSSKDRYPATPMQLQPPQGTYAHTQSPSAASSQHSHTPQSAQHSPMPALQYGVSTQAGTPSQYQPGLAPPPHSRAPLHNDVGSSPQQYRQPLGPPPLPLHAESPVSRRSSEQHAGFRSRGQSASVSPKTLPSQPSLSREASQNEMSHYSNVNGHASSNSHHAYANSQSYSASPAPLRPPSSATTSERHPVRRSGTMDLKQLLTPTTETPPPVAEMPSSKPPIDTDREPESRKRALEDDAAEQRPVKKERTRRHLERPAWAVYSRKNPRSSGAPPPPRPARQNGMPSAAAPAPARATNGTSARSNVRIDFDQPWRNEYPYDTDLIHAREVLGGWEKSIRWNTPYPDILRAVQDWLMHNLEHHKDILQSPEFASIEIEAKIGQLIKHDTGAKAALPIMNMAVLAPSVNRDHRFESALEEADAELVNNFLNTCLRNSQAPGRHAMTHHRVKETDSFLNLSKAGIDMLPDSLKRVSQHGRGLSLRSTTDERGKTTARIVKVSISDLHIYNPAGYDCRISMNAEVDFLRDNVAPEAITLEPSEKSPAQPSRRKDRISYKHLAYSIDLTGVQVSGMPAKQEIEIEVDAQVLSAQIRLMKEGKPHAFSDVVSGFLDNATFLMRQKQQQPPPPPPPPGNRSR